MTYKTNWTMFKVLAGLTYKNKNTGQVEISRLGYSPANLAIHAKDALAEVNRSVNPTKPITSFVIG